MRYNQLHLGLGFVLMAASCAGCVSRSIVIDSDPPGAQVWLNDVPLGRTPVESDFKFYGTYDVRLQLEGYEPLITSAEAKAPLYEQPGIDLLAAPFPLRNRVAWNFKLTPLPEVSDRKGTEQAAIERAKQLRQRSAEERAAAAPAPSEDK
jgi:hypothetical protein